MVSKLEQIPRAQGLKETEFPCVEPKDLDCEKVFVVILPHSQVWEPLKCIENTEVRKCLFQLQTLLRISCMTL